MSRKWDFLLLSDFHGTCRKAYTYSMVSIVCTVWYEKIGSFLTTGITLTVKQKTIRQAILEFDQGLSRTEPTEHILHCLDALRQDVLCYADDTPRYTGFQPSGRSGTGQFRQCRDWSRLEAWAQQNTACWRYIHPHDPNFDSLERHKFCPEGSPYIAKVKEEFGDLWSEEIWRISFWVE